MNVFNYISNLLFTKKQPVIKNIDHEGDYQPFMINRWCSMLDKTTATIINSTSNSLYQVLENKNDHYKFLHYLLPRNRFTRIQYIKKNKTVDTSKPVVAMLAKKLELSEREINLYKDHTDIDLTKYEQLTKS